MSTALMIPESLNESPAVHGAFLALVGDAKRTANVTLAAPTVESYRRDWKAFIFWCDTYGLESLPAASSTVAVYLHEVRKRRKAQSLTPVASAIARAHRDAGYPSLTESGNVKSAIEGIRRTKGIAATRKAPVAARGSATVLSKATTIAAAPFMITSLSLAIMATRHAGSSQSVLDRQKKPPVKTTPGPVQPVKPALPNVQIGPDGGPAVAVPIEPPAGKKK